MQRLRGRLALRIESVPLTARRAAWIISVVTLLLTVAAALLAWVLDEDDFQSFGTAAWWALQTVTTVGYGDFVPHNTEGRLIGAVVMLIGIAFVAVVTAAIAAAFVESARRKQGGIDERALAARIDEIATRLERIERSVQASSRPPGDAGG
jgi:voltage-gated potassium channel